MSEEPFLILHRVRGSPAFDIAIKVDCPTCHADPSVVNFIVPTTENCSNCNGEGFDWTIPTSGHRAYPWWYININELIPTELIPSHEDIYLDDTVGEAFAKGRLSMPPDWPDHYATMKAPHPPSPSGSLAQRLGLVPKTEPVIINRRI